MSFYHEQNLYAIFSFFYSDFLSSSTIFRAASYEELLEVPDIGEITAQGIYDFFKNEENQKVLEEFAGQFVPVQRKSAVFSSRIAGAPQIGQISGKWKGGASSGLFSFITASIEKIGEMRGTLSYDIDGAVIKVNHLKDREKIG